MGRRCWAMLLGAGLLLPVIAAAQAPSEEALRLSHEIVVKLGMERRQEAGMLTTRQAMIDQFKIQGRTEAEAREITDSYMMPAFIARRPELMTRYEEVLVRDYSAAEMGALLAGMETGPLRTAVLKALLLSQHFSEAARDWAGKVGRDVQAQNTEALEKLGLGKRPVK